MRGIREYEIRCDRGHSRQLNATELESLIHSGEFECDKCELAMNLTDHVTLECYTCHDELRVTSLAEASSWIAWEGCNHCGEYRFGGFHVRGSFQEAIAMYHWARNGQDAKPLLRVGRSDYWEGLIHFCDADEFAAIYEERTINAAKTGYFDLPAVCLTEATIGNWEELRERHGHFAYIFRKRDIIAAGGAPALYIPEHLIKAQASHGGFAESIKPFVNLLRIPSVTPQRSKHDFLHEREWRVASSITFEHLTPFAVLLGKIRAQMNWAPIFGAAHEFEELSVDQFVPTP